MKNLIKFIFFSILSITLGFFLPSLINQFEKIDSKKIKVFLTKSPEIISNEIEDAIVPTIIPIPTPTLIPTIFMTPTIGPTKTPPTPTLIWGKASQISEHSWTMNIENDDRMTTPTELLDALNSYRNRHGRSTLSLDDNLVKFAKLRVDKFIGLGKTDEHSGFNDYLKDNDNFKKLGFRKLGENSSSGYQLYGVHVIEWIYAGDKPHDDNQLDPEWSHVGIGVNGNMTDLVFGGFKM
jgi:uncharacterized protein YkwD